MNSGKQPEIPIPASIERLVLALLHPDDDIQSFFDGMTVLPEFEEEANSIRPCIWTREKEPVVMSMKSNKISLNNTLENFFTRVSKKKKTTGKKMSEGSSSESSEEIDSHVQNKSIDSDLPSKKDNVENPEEAYSQDMFSENVPSPEVSTSRKQASNLKKSDHNLSDEEIIPGSQCFSAPPRLSLSLSRKKKSSNLTSEESSTGDSFNKSVSPKKQFSPKKKADEHSSSDDSVNQTVFNIQNNTSPEKSINEIDNQDDTEEESAVNTYKSFDQKVESSKSPIRTDETNQVSRNLPRKTESLLRKSNIWEKSSPSNKSIIPEKGIDHNNGNSLELIREQMEDIELLSGDRKFYLDEITEYDELYVLKCPQFVDLGSLQGAEIAVEGESILCLENEGKSISYNSYSTRNSGKVNLNLIGSKQGTNDVKLGVFPLKGCINLIEHEESSQTDENEEKLTVPLSPVNSIKLPHGIKFRHSSAGNLVDSFYEGDSDDFIKKKKTKKIHETSEDNVRMEICWIKTELPNKIRKRKLNEQVSDVDPLSNSCMSEHMDTPINKKKHKQKNEDILSHSYADKTSELDDTIIKTEESEIPKKKRKHFNIDSFMESVTGEESVTTSDDLIVSKKRNKKKKHHEDPQVESVIPAEYVTTPDDIQQEDLIVSKKKKKKKKHNNEDVQNEQETRLSFLDSSVDAALNTLMSKRKKKKRKRGDVENMDESVLTIKEENYYIDENMEQTAIEEDDVEDMEESVLTIKEENYYNDENVEQTAIEEESGVTRKKKKKKRSHTSD